MNMNGIAEEYREWANLWETIDYADKASVRKCNRAADRMRKIVQEAEGSGPDAVAVLLPLLDEAIPAKWLAHHLVEMTSIDKATKKQCFQIVKQHIRDLRSKGQAADVMGEEMWLREHKKG